jgi:hypothetical protein
MKRISCLLLLLVGLLPCPAFAATSLTAAGLVSDAADGTSPAGATVRVYRTAEPAVVASLQAGTYETNLWLGEVGASFSDYQVGDELIAIIEQELDDGELTHAGYYNVQSITLGGLDPVSFADKQLRALPVPSVTLDAGYTANLSWSAATEDGSGKIGGYRIWRSDDGIDFTYLASVDSSVQTYQDSSFPATTHYYALSLAYSDEVAPDAPLLSANSNLCYDLDGDGLTSDSDEDDDSDGLPDSWEETYGLDPEDASDAELDGDNDGLTNLEEYTLGTDPTEEDTDDDGFDDGCEQTCGADPLDEESGCQMAMPWIPLLLDDE